MMFPPFADLSTIVSPTLNSVRSLDPVTIYPTSPGPRVLMGFIPKSKIPTSVG